MLHQHSRNTTSYLVLYACSYTPALTRLHLHALHACPYTPAFTRLPLHACPYTPYTPAGAVGSEGPEFYTPALTRLTRLLLHTCTYMPYTPAGAVGSEGPEFYLECIKLNLFNSIASLAVGLRYAAYADTLRYVC